MSAMGLKSLHTYSLPHSYRRDFSFLLWTGFGGRVQREGFQWKATPLNGLGRSLSQDIQEVGLAWPCACVSVVYSGLGDEIMG